MLHVWHLWWVEMFKSAMTIQKTTILNKDIHTEKNTLFPKWSIDKIYKNDERGKNHQNT